MKTIIIDDEPWMLRHFGSECEGVDEIELVGSFRNPLIALEYAQNNLVDLAFVDIEMPQINGVETAKRLSKILTDIRIIIVSAYDESYIRTNPECASYGYLRKPYKCDDLRAAINKIELKR